MMSQENLDVDYQITDSNPKDAANERMGQLPEKVTDLYNLDDSYDSLLPQQRNAAAQAKNFG